VSILKVHAVWSFFCFVQATFRAVSRRMFFRGIGILGRADRTRKSDSDL